MPDKNQKAYWFTVKAGDEVIVLSALRELGIEAKPLTPRRSGRFGAKCGPGFGDHVWRVNCRDERIEASFSHPCADSRTLKQAGFKWDHEQGVWYSDDTDATASFLNALGLKQAAHVLAEK